MNSYHQVSYPTTIFYLFEVKKRLLDRLIYGFFPYIYHVELMTTPTRIETDPEYPTLPLWNLNLTPNVLLVTSDCCITRVHRTFVTVIHNTDQSYRSRITYICLIPSSSLTFLLNPSLGYYQYVPQVFNFRSDNSHLSIVYKNFGSFLLQIVVVLPT